MGLRDRRRQQQDEPGEIPMAAMPDIAFLLLVFFLVSTSFLVTQKLDVELPAYSDETRSEPQEHVNVFLGAESLRVKFGDEDQTMELWKLEEYISGALASAESAGEKVVLLEVKDDCRYPRVVEAFDGIRAAGGYVSLVEPGS